MTKLQKEDKELTEKWAEKVVNDTPMGSKLNKFFAFYGTLREGGYNHARLVAQDKGAKKLGEMRITGYKMFDLGHYPFAVKTGDKKDSMVVELYELQDEYIIELIHRMEVGALYGIEKETINNNTYWVYVYDDAKDYGGRGYKAVPDGDWATYKGYNKKKQELNNDF